MCASVRAVLVFTPNSGVIMAKITIQDRIEHSPSRQIYDDKTRPGRRCKHGGAHN